MVETCCFTHFHFRRFENHTRTATLLTYLTFAWKNFMLFDARSNDVYEIYFSVFVVVVVVCRWKKMPRWKRHNFKEYQSLIWYIMELCECSNARNSSKCSAQLNTFRTSFSRFCKRSRKKKVTKSFRCTVFAFWYNGLPWPLTTNHRDEKHDSFCTLNSAQPSLII